MKLVLVCSGKQPGYLKQQTFITHTSGVVEFKIKAEADGIPGKGLLPGSLTVILW
jgi:hypothetical protein